MRKSILINTVILFIAFISSHYIFNKFYFNINTTTQIKSSNKSPENPLERIKQRVQIRADANGYIPMDGLIKAREQRDQLLAATISKSKKNMNQIQDGGIWGWEWLGPGNIGGRIRAILIDPDSPSRIWIGSVSGGIWVTENGGDYWEPVDDFMANLAISSIVMDSKNHDIMYAGTGEVFTGDVTAHDKHVGVGLPGAGIFKSTDRGRTWKLLPTTNNNDFKFVSKLACHPTESDIIYASTLQGVFQSKNGGVTWTSKLPLWDTRDIKISLTNPKYILVGSIRDVFLSDDGGSSFTKLTTGAIDKLPDTTGRCEVYIAPSTSKYMYVSKDINNGEIWRTSDHGITWELKNSGTNYFLSGNGHSQGGYDNALWVSPMNANLIVVGGIDLWRSNDGGETLDKISDWRLYHTGISAHADHHIIVDHPNFDGYSNKTVYFGNDGGIQKTDDINEVSSLSGWKNLANNLGITQFYGGAAVSRSQTGYGGWIFGGTQDNSTLRYKPEDGINWYQAITGDGGFCTVNDNAPLVLTNLIEMPYLDIWKGEGNAATYVPSHLGIKGVGERKGSLFISPLVNAPQKKVINLAGGVDIWKSISGGAFWSSIFLHPDSSRCSAIDILWDGKSSVYCGYENGDLYRATEGGEGTWTRIDNDSTKLPDNYITDIAVINFGRKDWVFVTFGSFNDPNIWFSDDGGDTWRDATGTEAYKLPNVPINTVRFHPADPYSVYIGTDLGVYASDNLGVTWSVVHSYPNNEGPANVEVAELFWQDDYLIAATHGRGMYRCRPKTFIYVDKSADPELADGSLTYPYTKVKDAINSSGNGTNIYIIGNTYSEAPIIFDRAGTINAVNGNVIIK